MKIKEDLTPEALMPAMEKMWEVSASKIRSVETSYPPGKGAPVFTACAGSWIAPRDLIAEGNFSEITRRAREAVETAGKTQNA